MSIYDEKLAELQGKLRQKEHLTAKLQSLRAQHTALTAQVEELRQSSDREQRDVTALEMFSFANFVATIKGDKEERLDKEKAEAYAAQVKYTMAQNQLDNLTADISGLTQDIHALGDCQRQYDALLAEKLTALAESNAPEATRIFNLLQQLTDLEHQNLELDEAIAAGKCAQSTASTMAGSLDSAQGWSTFDMLGGGLLADMAKYDAMDQAQAYAETLTRQLSAFKSELADVKISESFDFSIGGGLQVADIFFDNIFTDWAVRDSIKTSGEQAQSVLHRIQTTLGKLETMRYQCEETKRTVNNQLKSLAETVPM